MVGLAKGIDEKEIKDLGSDRIDAMVNKIEPSEIENMKTEKLGGMMAGLKADKIEALDAEKKMSVLDGLGAKMLPGDATVIEPIPISAPLEEIVLKPLEEDNAELLEIREALPISDAFNPFKGLFD